MPRILDAIGTALSKFQIGIRGPQLKNNAGTIEVRNAADSQYGQMRALVAAITGDDIILNEQASSTGDSWKYTLRRPATGMTHDLTVVMPSGDPAVGQALTVASFAANVVTLQWTTVAGGTDKMVVDTTSLAFGDTSPKPLFSKPANTLIDRVEVIVDNPFDGTPALSIGIAGTPSKYVASTLIDLSAAATTVFEIAPGLPATAGAESLIATYAAGGATAGAARILVHYVQPS